MTDFLTGFGAKLADRWATLLVLPGVIYLSAAVAAVELGHEQALNSGRVAAEIDALSTFPASSNPGVIILVLIAVLALSAVSGLLASALGRLLEWYWHLPSGRWFVGAVTWRRRCRWQRLDRTAKRLVAQDAQRCREGGQLSPATVRALARRDRVSTAPPMRTTWAGDRFRVVYDRIGDAYSIDLRSVWPGLWLSLPDQTRTEIVGARDAYGASSRLGGWAIMYLIVGTIWWPAMGAFLVLAVTARFRTRQTAAALADLIEAAVDCHGRDLAISLGLGCPGPLTRQEGQRMSDLLGKSGTGISGQDGHLPAGRCERH